MVITSQEKLLWVAVHSLSKEVIDKLNDAGEGCLGLDTNTGLIYKEIEKARVAILKLAEQIDAEVRS